MNLELFGILCAGLILIGLAVGFVAAFPKIAFALILLGVAVWVWTYEEPRVHSPRPF